MQKLILVTGVPATGKTWLGNWLAEVHDFVHINLEHDDAIHLDLLGVRDEWEQLTRTGRGDHFVAALRRLAKPVIISWGFPVHCLYIVQALKTSGVAVWWLTGERHHARRAYVARYLRGEGPHPANFNQQMDQIDQHWLLIQSVVADQLITALRADGTQETPQELWRQMAGA
jgi:hypothetical protein